MAERSQEGAEPLPDLVRTMIEAVAKYMGADTGKWRIDFELEDGKLSRWTRQQGPTGAKALGELAPTSLRY